MEDTKMKRLLFVHTPKTGGVFLGLYIINRLKYCRIDSVKRNEDGVASVKQ